MIQSRSAAAESAYGDLGVKKAPPSLDSLAQGLGGHPGKQLHIAAGVSELGPPNHLSGRKWRQQGLKPGCLRRLFS
jgi:hypothetical protein